MKQKNRTKPATETGPQHTQLKKYTTSSLTQGESSREINGKVSCERRYYLCSITDVTRIAKTIRQHWAIENQQHWILDVQFGEDAHRTRKNHSAANLGLIRRTALNLLQQDTSNKWSIRRRKMRANFDLRYRETVLFKTGQVINT